MDPDEYIGERVKQYQSWYDRKAVVAKSRFIRMRSMSVVGGALVPVLANISMDANIGSSTESGGKTIGQPSSHLGMKCFVIETE
jgi:uncharacterized protein DUF4231